MYKKFTLSLLIYSGRENPAVVISEMDFNSILSLIIKQKKLVNCNFIPNLGAVGFSLHSPDNIIIDFFSQVSTRESKSNVTYFLTNPLALKMTYELFFKLYKGDDLKVLQAIVKKSLFLD